MEFRKNGIVLLVLLLATVAIVPMVAAAPSSDGSSIADWSKPVVETKQTTGLMGTRGMLDAYAYGQKSGSQIVYAGKGFHNGGSVTSMTVQATLYDPNNNQLASRSATCGAGNTCFAGYYYYSPSVPGTYHVTATVNAPGHSQTSASTYFTW